MSNINDNYQDRTCFFLGKKCPRCGCTLISDGRKAWCSFVDCTFGIDKHVLVSELEDT